MSKLKMNGDNLEGKEKYGRFLLTIKWLIGITELGGGIYVMMQFHEMLGIIFGAYAMVAGILILPLSSCVNCHYFGKRCHCGLGIIAKRIYYAGNPNDFIRSFSWRIFIYPVWALPVFAALLNALRMRKEEQLIIFAAFSMIVFINRRLLMKHPSCKHCLQRFHCPGCQFRTYVPLDGSSAESIREQ